jgi:hypothetical protein
MPAGWSEAPLSPSTRAGLCRTLGYGANNAFGHPSRLRITTTAAHVPTIAKKPKTDYNQPVQDWKTSYSNDLM